MSAFFVHSSHDPATAPLTSVKNSLVAALSPPSLLVRWGFRPGTWSAPLVPRARAERRGQEVFFGRGQCGICHVAPYYTDNPMHDLKIERFFNRGPADQDVPAVRHQGLSPHVHDVRLLTRSSSSTWSLAQNWPPTRRRTSSSERRYADQRRIGAGEFGEIGARHRNGPLPDRR
jgi:hypothetical protein